MCEWYSYVHVCLHVRRPVVYTECHPQSFYTLFYLLRQSSSLNLELTDWASVISQFTQGILSQPLERWGKKAAMSSQFLLDPQVRIWTQVLVFAWQEFYPPSFLPTPILSPGRTHNIKCIYIGCKSGEKNKRRIKVFGHAHSGYKVQPLTNAQRVYRI